MMERKYLVEMVKLLKKNGVSKEMAYLISEAARTENRAKEMVKQIQSGLDPKDYMKAAIKIAETID